MSNPFHPYPFPRLTVELVPAKQWGDNLRSHLTRTEWDDLRQACYKRANHRCEICGGVGRNHPVECHEIWDYNDSAMIQTLTGLIALCPACHGVKHIGRAAATGNLHKALLHIMQVNEWPGELAEEYVGRQFQIHSIRSQFNWVINLDWLKNSAKYVEDIAVFVREARRNRVRATLDAMTRKRES